MKNKLTDLLSGLEKREIKRFEQFLLSPYFNTNDRNVVLFGCLSKYHPHYNDPKLSFRLLFDALFKGKKFDEQKVRYAMTDLTLLLERFIALETAQQNDDFHQQMLLVGLHQRNHDKYFLQTLRAAQEQQAKDQIRDTQFYHHQLLLEEEAYKFTATRQNRTLDSSLQQLSDNIDIHFLTQKLKYSCEILNRQNVLSAEYDTRLLDVILAYLDEHPFEEIPAIHIYLTILLTLKEPEDEQHYYRLKGLLIENKNHFTATEMRDMYAFLQNYCIRKANLGKAEYMGELLNAFKLLLENGFIFENGFISPADFKNIVTVALRRNEHEWVAHFLASHSIRLRKEFRSNAKDYNYARLSYNLGELKQARKLLSKTDFTDLYYHLDSKVLLMKTYYELDDFEPLLALIGSFRVYLKRNRKISDYQRTIYLNLIKYVRKITRIKLGSRLSAKSILEEVQELGKVADQRWLEQKLTELMA